MSHDTDGTGSIEGSSPRDVRGSDGESGATLPDGGDAEQTEPDAIDTLDEVEAELEEESERVGPLGAIAEFTGPLPPASILRGYEELVPGSASNIINAHVNNENARAGALTRLTRAESFGVVMGTIGAQVVAVGGLAAGMVLIVLGYPAESLLGFIPAGLSGVAVVVSAVKGNRAD